MAQITVNLPNMVQTSSAVDTSTGTVPYVDISDAITLSGFINGNTTAPGFLAQVSYDGESTAPTFVTLGHYSLSSAGSVGSSGFLPMYLTSGAFRIPDIAAKRFRVATSNVTSTSATIVLAKSMHV